MKTFFDLSKQPIESKDEFKPHKMYDPKTGDEVSVKDEAEHEKYNKMGWVHDKPKLEVAEPEAEKEKEFKAKHVVKKSGAKDDGSIVKEAKHEEPEEEEQEDEVDEASEKQKKYQAFFQKALKKFGAKSPAELDKEKRKEFFNYVDKNYEADSEED